MKLHISKDIIEHLIKVGVFVCLVVVLVQVHSVRSNGFRYHYSEGRPWAYEELQAPFDFPIYKSEAEVEQSRNEALESYYPCFRLQTVDINAVIDSISANISYPENIAVKASLKKNLGSIYAVGMVSGEVMSYLNDSGYKYVKIIDSRNVARNYASESCFTPMSAYSKIKAETDTSTFEILEQQSFYRHLYPNLSYDSLLSANLRADLLSSVSITEGAVQQGERIIARGEIVTAEKYKILNSLARTYTEKYSSGLPIWSLVGDVLLEVFFVLLLILYLVRFRPTYYQGMKNVIFFLLLVVLMVSLSAGAVKLGERLDMQMFVYIVPLAWIPILVRVFFDARTSLYIHWITLILVALMLDDPFTYVIIQVAVGMVVVTSLKDISERSQLARTALYIFLTYAFTYTALTLSVTGDVSKLDWMSYVMFGVNATLLLLAYGLIFVCEKVFKMLSSMTLVELSNVNSDLMLRLAEEAPGTFQHCLQVANLASEAAKRIGADSLLVRTGAMYHDIGKMVCPHNFTENQVGGANPLSQMPILDAVSIVLSHVSNGVSMAKKEHLPQPITDFITTHHGTSKARYFYNTYKNQHPDEEVDESLFTYPGPRPFTREQGILMMADAVEARSRSLQEYTEQSIDEMVEQMVSAQMNDGQLRDTPLTFKDIENIKAVFKQKLQNIYHHRITYPELKK